MPSCSTARSCDTASLNLAAGQLSRRIAQLQATGAGKAPLATQLVAKQQQLQELEALQSSNASVTAAAVKASKVSPKPTEYLVLGIIAGIVLAAIAAAALEALDTKIRSDDELETRLGLTLIGYIPPPPRRVRKSLLMMREPSAPAGEGFRFVALNLQRLMANHDIRSLMVSSAVDGEGKSTTIANLAVTFARGGMNVALVDLDLRRPALHTLFDLGPGAGITDVAYGRVDLENALQLVELKHFGGAETNGDGRPTGRLSVLRCGLLPPSPSEFMEDPAVERIIAELCADNAIVLIDSPPVLVTNDALSLSRLTDAMFIVARVPKIRRGMTVQLRRVLSGARSPILGVVRTGRRGSTTFPDGTRSYSQGPAWRPRDHAVPQLARAPLLRRSRRRHLGTTERLAPACGQGERGGPGRKLSRRGARGAALDQCRDPARGSRPHGLAVCLGKLSEILDIGAVLVVIVGVVPVAEERRV